MDEKTIYTCACFSWDVCGAAEMVNKSEQKS